VHEREAVKRYLDQLEHADQQDEVVIDSSAVAAALEKLQRHPEPEARFMRTNDGKRPAYNVQTAVDAAHALVVAQQVTTEPTDHHSLLPMAEAAQQAIGPSATMNVVADAGYTNAQQIAACEQRGIVPHVPAQRGVNNQGDGTQFDRRAFAYDENSDSFRCPAGQPLTRRRLQVGRNRLVYQASAKVCRGCKLKDQCTQSKRRTVYRLVHEEALARAEQRATPEAMRLRRCTAEHPFAMLKYRIFGHPRFLLRGLRGAQIEISLATLVYNLNRMMSVLGGRNLVAALCS
jgi:transposase